MTQTTGQTTARKRNRAEQRASVLLGRRSDARELIALAQRDDEDITTLRRGVSAIDDLVFSEAMRARGTDDPDAMEAVVHRARGAVSLLLSQLGLPAGLGEDLVRELVVGQVTLVTHLTNMDADRRRSFATMMEVLRHALATDVAVHSERAAGMAQMLVSTLFTNDGAMLRASGMDPVQTILETAQPR